MNNRQTGGIPTKVRMPPVFEIMILAKFLKIAQLQEITYLEVALFGNVLRRNTVPCVLRRCNRGQNANHQAALFRGTVSVYLFMPKKPHRRQRACKARRWIQDESAIVNFGFYRKSAGVCQPRTPPSPLKQRMSLWRRAPTGEKSASASAFGKGRWISGRSKRPIPTFAFSCDRCGRCCREREDVLLNPADLFRIAKFLNQTPSQVVEHYCECCIGPDSGLPLIRLKPKAYRNTCPFLGSECCCEPKS